MSWATLPFLALFLAGVWITCAQRPKVDPATQEQGYKDSASLDCKFKGGDMYLNEKTGSTYCGHGPLR